MNTTAEKVKEILVAGFPHWSQLDVDRMTKFLSWYFKEHTKNDGNYVVAATSALWSYTKERARAHNKDWHEVRPGYVRYPLTNWGRVTDQFNNLYIDANLRKLTEKNQLNLEHVTMMRETFEMLPEFDARSSADKVADYIRKVDAIMRFTKAEAPVWYTMKEVAEELVGETVEDFWEEVKLRCLENDIHMSPANWRQIKKRILDRMNTQALGAKDMLQMVSSEEPVLRKLLKVVERLENSDNQLRSDVNEILSEYALPDAFKDEVFVIVKLVIQKLREPSNSLAGDYDYSKYEEEVDELVSILQDFDQSYFDNILKDTLLTDTSLLVKACLLVLLSILKDLNEEEINILKDRIHA